MHRTGIQCAKIYEIFNVEHVLQYLIGETHMHKHYAL